MLSVPGDGIILKGTNPSSLGYANVVAGSVTVRAVSPEGDGAQGSRYGNTTTQRVYVENTDYTVDYTAGTITRTSGSAIPSCPVGPSDSGYSGGSLGPYIVWVTYQTTDSSYQSFSASSALSRLAAKLAAAQSIKLLVIGDSTASDPAGETQSMDQAWWRRMVARWQTFGSTVYYANRAVGGTTSASGSSQFATISLSATSATDYYNQWTYTFPAGAWDVVAIGFGMNDITGGSGSVSTYQTNILATVDAIRASCPNADIVLMPTAWGNPAANSNFTQANARLYRDALSNVAAARSHVFVANHLPTWESYQPRIGRALLNNDINHPTNTGHWIYAQPLVQIEPQSVFTVSSSGTWVQSGSSVTIRDAIAGVRNVTTASVYSSTGGRLVFGGTHASRFQASIDGVNWSPSVAIAPATPSTVYLGVTRQSGDPTLTAQIGVPL